jgi:hypothetical protein
VTGASSAAHLEGTDWPGRGNGQNSRRAEEISSARRRVCSWSHLCLPYQLQASVCGRLDSRVMIVKQAGMESNEIPRPLIANTK